MSPKTGLSRAIETLFCRPAFISVYYFGKNCMVNHKNVSMDASSGKSTQSKVNIIMTTQSKLLCSILRGTLAAILGCFAMIAGCESGTTDSEEILVAPSIANISASKGDGVLFVVNSALGSTFSTSTTTNGSTVTTTTSSGTTNQTLFYPLEWSVSTPSLGFIRTSSGNTAIYESLGGRGNNIVTVRDQDGKTGQAVVVQN